MRGAHTKKLGETYSINLELESGAPKLHEIKKGLIFVYLDVSKILLHLGIAVPTPVTINMPTVIESYSIIIAPIAMHSFSIRLVGFIPLCAHIIYM